MLTTALDLRPLGDDNEAIPTDLASEIFDRIANAGYAILGGEYWDLVSGKLERAYEVWGVTPRGAESWADYIERAHAQATADLTARGIQSDVDRYVSIDCVGEGEYGQLYPAI